MGEDGVESRLAAIFAGDIAGYSRLMGAGEEGKLRQLKAHPKELIDPNITEHRGRIGKTTDDGRADRERFREGLRRAGST
jgi:adenylate cyclase